MDTGFEAESTTAELKKKPEALYPAWSGESEERTRRI
jgi:hypothetical protein